MRDAAVVRWSALVAALEQHRTAAGLAHDAALAEARREAAWLVLTARDTPAGAVMATLDRVADAVDALAAERDGLRDRITRATAELDAAPDADPERPSKRAMREVLQANTRAWAVLAEGRDPPSKHRGEDAPRDPDGGDCSRPTSPAAREP